MRKFKLLSKKLIFFLSAFLVAGALIAGYSFLHSKSASAAWFDDKWSYRQTVALTNSGSNQTNYQIKITLDTSTLITASKIQSDCDDLRITDINGKLLPHWIETGTNACNTATTAIWAKAPSITTSGATVYIYYGNPTASNAADGNKVFEFFDDFSKTSVDTTKWTSTGSPAISSGELTLSNSAGIVSNSTQSTNDQTKTLGFRAKTASTTVNTARLGYSNTNTLSTTYYNDDAANVVLGPETTYLSATAGSNYIGHYTFDSLSSLSNGDAVTEASSNSNDLVSVNGATVLDPSQKGKGLTFNGTTQYLKQKVFLSGAQNSRVDTAGSAAIDLTGLDTYATASQPYSYMIVSTNCTTTGWGYLGAVISGSNLKVFSTKTGTTQNWATVPSGGTCNAFEIRKTDFQITGNITVGAWVKPTTNKNWNFILAKDNDGDDSIRLYTNSSGTVIFNLFGLTDAHIESTTNISAGVWTHIAATYNGSTKIIYINGVAASGADTSSGSINDTAEPFVIGGDSIAYSSYMFSGSIDSPLVLSSALSAAQVKALYHSSGSKYGVMTDNAAASNLTEAASGTTSIDSNTYHNFEITQKSSSSTLSIDGTATTSSTNSPNSAQYIRFENSDASNAVTLDWVYVRKTASTEPSAAAPASEEQGPGPVAYFKFDEGRGTSTKDSSSSGLTGSIAGGATWQTEDQCISGKCLYFDGSDDEISVSNAPVLTPSDNWSVSFWSKSNPSQTTWNGVIYFKAGEGWGIYARHNNNANTPFLYTETTSTGATNQYFSGSTAQSYTNDWKHFVLTKSGTTYKWYVNGRLDNTQNKSTGDVTNNTTSTWKIAFSYSQRYKGFLDEIKVYKYARSANQVKQDYSSGLSNAGTKQGTSAVLGASPEKWLSDGLVGYWKMDDAGIDAEGETITDSSGNANTGTLYGDNSVGDNGTGLDCTAAGKFGTACNLDGVDDYVSVADNSNLDIGTGDFSVSVWFTRNTSATTNLRLLSKGAAAEAQTGWAFFGSDTSLTTIIGNGTARISASGTHAGLTVWNHATMVVKRNDKLYLYLNGTLANSTDISSYGTTDLGSTYSLFFGRDAADSQLYWTGKTDDVRIYNRALSSKEVSDLYNWAPGPVGYWNFEEKTGSSAYDTSGGGNTGTITNSTWNTGKFGSGLSFDGNGDFVNIPQTTTLDTPTGTISMWAYFSDLTDNGYLWSQNSDEWSIYNNGSQLKGYYDGTAVISYTPTFTTNQWVHLSFTFVKGSTCYLYVNGVQATSGTCSSTAPTLSNTHIGSISSSGSYSFNGKIDDVRVYNYQRTAKQVVQDMNAGHPSVGSPVGSAVGYWKFDEGTDNTCSGGTNDACNSGSAGSTNDGAATSTTWTNSGKFGKALVFNGSTSKIDIGTGSGLDFGANNFTLSAWIYPTNTAGVDVIYSNSTFIFYQENGTFKFQKSSGSYETVSGGTIGTNTWYHVAFVRQGTGTNQSYLYINGKQTAVGTIPDLGSSATNNAIGYDQDVVGRYFTGTIDEVRTYNYALTTDELLLDINRGSSMVLGSLSDNSSYQTGAANQEYCIPGDSTSCTAPVGRWDFEERTGANAYDKSGNGYTGTVTIGATGSQTTTAQAWKTGKVGAAVNLDGTDDYIDPTGINGFGTLAGSSFTVSLWFNTGNTNTRQSIIGDWDAAGSNDSFSIETGGYLQDSTHITTHNKTGGSINYLDSNVVYSPNTWYHVEVTNDASTTTRRIYINGVLKNSDANTGINAGSKLTIGRGGAYSGLYFKGLVDQVRIFNYARTAAQVAWDYNRGKPVGWWKLDDCQGTTANDSSGNSNSGTITIGASGEDTVGTCTTSSTAWGSGATGKRNYSLNFDGTDDFVNLGQVLPTAVTTPFTFAAWVNPAAAGASSWRTIIGTHTSFAEIAINSSNQFTCGQNGGGGFFDAVSTVTITNGTWYHVTCTYDGSNIRVYINGKQEKLGTSRTFTNASHGVSLLGRYQTAGGEWMNGQIDDAKIYNYALTSAQIKEVMNDGAVRFGPLTGSP